MDAAGAQVAAAAWHSLEATTAQVAAGVILPALLAQGNGGGGGGFGGGSIGGSVKARDSGRYKMSVCRNFMNVNHITFNKSFVFFVVYNKSHQ